MQLFELVIDTGDNDEEYCERYEKAMRGYGTRAVDWQVFAEEVLEKVDQQLKKFRLELVQHFTDSDCYRWHIGKRVPGNDAPPKLEPCDSYIRTVNWNAFTDEVLERVDEQLEKFGLEVFEHDTGSDCYRWHIGKRVVGDKPSPRANSKEPEWLFELLDCDPDDPWRSKEDLAQWRKERRAYFAALKAKSGGGKNEDEGHDIIGPGAAVLDDE